MRIDIKNRTPEHTEFLRRLRAWDATLGVSASPADFALVEELAPVAAAVDKTVTRAMVVPTSLSTVRSSATPLPQKPGKGSASVT